MRSLIGRFVSRFRREPELAELRVDDVGVTFVLNDGSLRDAFRWSDVEEIQTFKVDLGVVDDIRLAFRVQDRWYEVGEDMDGFSRLSEKMEEMFPIIPADWYFEVMHPPFAANPRTLYSRG